MSARFWLFSLACAGGALTGGLGLGVYATSQPRAAWTQTVLPEAQTQESRHDPASPGMTGPAIVNCKGCGPTLADRQMAAVTGWDGMDDPAVRDYDAEHGRQPVDYGEPPALMSVQRLPASIESFASGDSERSWQPVMVAQAQGKAPAEETPTDASASY